jgi:uncharacterized protein (DUF1684 family)
VTVELVADEELLVDGAALRGLATCPLPPPENRLPVAIEAGEKIPVERS